tara:strand:+ start:447 stop:632 length:186 start_codon:yes stop_codon:yes gene_type:complete
MFPKALMSVCAVNMVLAVYMGLFIPVELHGSFALESRDYFVLSFVGFCFGLLNYLRVKDES